MDSEEDEDRIRMDNFKNDEEEDEKEFVNNNTSSKSPA